MKNIVMPLPPFSTFFIKRLDKKVNLSKSRILFSKNCPTIIRDLSARSLGIKEQHSFGKYLGFPIFHKSPTNIDFQYLLDNMRKKLVGWKKDTLCMAGRLVLAETSLSGVPSHVMNYNKLPTKFVSLIDKTIRDFIWESSEDKKKMHLLNGML